MIILATYDDTPPRMGERVSTSQGFARVSAIDFERKQVYLDVMSVNSVEDLSRWDDNGGAR